MSSTFNNLNTSRSKSYFEIIFLVFLIQILPTQQIVCSCTTTQFLVDQNGTSVPHCPTACNVGCFKQMTWTDVNATGGIVTKIECNPCDNLCLNSGPPAYHASCTQCCVGCEICSGPFIPDQVLGCLSCPATYHAQCTTCDSSKCLTCNTPYLPHAVAGCITCPYYHPNCTVCSSTQCTACNTGYAPSVALGCVLGTSYHALCLACNGTECTSCSSIYLPSLSRGCYICPDYHINCTTCTASQCSTCDTGYGVSLSVGCVLCVSYHPQCLTCDGTVCQTCAGIYLPHPTNGCYICPDYHLNCTTCDIVQCLTCDVGYAASPNATIGCVLCVSYHSQCLACNYTNCTSCATPYLLHPLNGCKSCPDYHPSCLTCDAVQCFSCNLTFVEDVVLGCDLCTNVYDPECLYCDITACTHCMTNFYLNFTTSNLTCDSCSYFKCTSCIDGPQCTSCSAGYYLSSTFTCEPCANLCKQCLGDPLNCTACYGESLNINNTCRLSGCQSFVYISGALICLSCDVPNNFAFINNTCKCDAGYQVIIPLSPGTLKYCQSICGDGIPTSPSENCDDGNTIQNDGCYNCQPQQDYVCTSTSPSKCSLHINFYLIEYNYAYKVEGENQGILSFTIQPTHIGLKNMDWKQLISLNISSMIKKDSVTYIYSLDTGELRISFTYLQELQNEMLETTIIFYPVLVVSNPSSYVLENKLNGINSPLVFQQKQMLTAYQASLWISQILVVLIMVQYVIGSYFHKMIGLQTLQILQFFYFSKMIVSSKSTSILNSLNSLKISCSGYSKLDKLLIDTATTEHLQKQKYTTVNESFLKANLQKYFLLNVNYFLALLLISGVVFLVYLVRKNLKRQEYLLTRDASVKDEYTVLKRSTQWVYDHVLFPSTMMFSLVSFFNFILNLLSFSNQQTATEIQSTSLISTLSYSSQLFIAFIIFCIFCFEIFYSYNQYHLSTLSKEERDTLSSVVQKLEHDDNSPDRANYHPLYVLIYLAYVLLMELAMVAGVMLNLGNLTLEFVLGTSLVYFLLIIIWKPYHNKASAHNKILTFNYAVLLSFLITCYLFQKTDKLSSSVYISMISCMLFFIGIVMVGGYARIFIQRVFRKWLQQNSNTLQNQSQEVKKGKKNIKGNLLTKKQKLFLDNQFLFENQLEELSKKYGIRSQGQNTKNINLQQRQLIIQRSREEFQYKNLLNEIHDVFPTKFSNENLQSKLRSRFDFYIGLPLNKLMRMDDQTVKVQQKVVMSESQKLKLIKQRLKRELQPDKK